MAGLYENLYLEEVEIPDNYKEIVEQNGLWAYDELPALSLTIQQRENGICFGMELYPFEDETEEMEKINNNLEQEGYEPNGYGWEEYLLGYLEKESSAFNGKISSDCEDATCGIYVCETMEEYVVLLALLSQAIRELAEKR